MSRWTSARARSKSLLPPLMASSQRRTTSTFSCDIARPVSRLGRWASRCWWEAARHPSELILARDGGTWPGLGEILRPESGPKVSDLGSPPAALQRPLRGILFDGSGYKDRSKSNNAGKFTTASGTAKGEAVSEEREHEGQPEGAEGEEASKLSKQ